MRRLPILTPSTLPPLPPLYDRWMREALGGAMPSEPEATCDACVMVAAPGDASAHGFDPDTKCCTHVPFLPNFLVGRILADRSGGAGARRGRASTRARIEGRVAVSPLGLHAPGPRRVMEQLAHEHGEFGRVPTLLCPHHVSARGGTCGIWEHRNAVCATFFCKHARGERGESFWQRGVGPLLRAVEEALARRCLLELELPATTLARTLASYDPADGARARGPELGPDPERYRALWGTWRGREEELYVACAEHVESLSWEDVKAAGGAELEARLRIARGAFEDMARREVPEALHVGTFSGAEVGRDHTLVATYSKLDPLALPNALVPALGRFDGRPTPVVTREIASDHGLELDRELLLRLVDFGILVGTPTRG